MRTGLLAAAVLAMVGASDVSAATFVQFEAQGIGTSSIQNAFGTTFKTGDLFYRFVIEVDPDYADQLSYGTGSTYVYQVAGESSYVRLSAGTIGMSYTADSLLQYSPRSSATISLMPASETTFSQIPGLSAASGTVSYAYPMTNGGYGVSGTVTKLVRLGVVGGFIAPSAVILPEPGAWGLMILGMMTIGAMLRRRRAGYASATLDPFSGSTVYR